MYCHACSSPILATDTRCINCNRLLIESSEKSLKSLKKQRVLLIIKFIMVGAFAGFLISVGFFYPDQDLIKNISPIGAIIGGLIGKHFAKQKWK